MDYDKECQKIMGVLASKIRGVEYDKKHGNLWSFLSALKLLAENVTDIDAKAIKWERTLFRDAPAALLLDEKVLNNMLVTEIKKVNILIHFNKLCHLLFRYLREENAAILHAMKNDHTSKVIERTYTFLLRAKECLDGLEEIKDHGKYKEKIGEYIDEIERAMHEMGLVKENADKWLEKTSGNSELVQHLIDDLG